MRQKYLIVPSKDSLTIKESSELDKGVFQQVGEATYDSSIVKIAKEGNIKELADALRSSSFYPANDCAKKLAEAVITVYKSAGFDPVEIAFSDIDQLASAEEKIDDTDASVAIDELLDDSSDDDLNGDDLLKDGNIKDISSTIKIADEDDLVDDDDT